MNTNSSVRKLTFVSFWVLVAGIFLVIYQQKSTHLSPANPNIEAVSDRPQKEAADNRFSSLTQNDLAISTPSRTININSSSPQLTIQGTPADAELIHRWRSARGTYTKHELEVYKAYGIETLEQLMRDGDMQAAIALAELYVSDKYVEQYGISYALAALQWAAIFGSTDALGRFGDAYRSLNYSSLDNPEMRHIWLESLAWENTAALRGDSMPNNSAEAFMKYSKFEVTEQEKRWIQERSNEIYNDLLKKRMDLGLGDFDNQTPPEVVRYFSHLTNYMDDVQ